MTCSFLDCNEPSRKLGLCEGHYYQKRKGKPLTKLHKTADERFWDKVIKGEGCWKWSGSKTYQGYGIISVNGKGVRAHRFSYAINRGIIPDGLEVRHLCHNKSCVNPEHLAVGTHKDNMMDSVRDGRTASGENNHHAKLTSKDVLLIRSDNRTYSEISQDYNVSPSTISNIKNNVTWRNENI